MVVYEFVFWVGKMEEFREDCVDSYIFRFLGDVIFWLVLYFIKWCGMFQECFFCEIIIEVYQVMGGNIFVEIEDVDGVNQIIFDQRSCDVSGGRYGVDFLVSID